MSDIVICAENLGKKYVIGHQADKANKGYTALRDVVAQNVRDLWRKTTDLLHGKPIVQGDYQEDFWALQDINFEVRQGEAVGIIGRNGAGKSTLLKILSRITEPSTGRATIHGRVTSLLEVGTGFHPELSGRENVYLNGAILGMTRNEIRRKFDEIVAFAEIEKYLDTPVKRYSSGMYVRLAFSVAAHLESEILVVDEVLAVGDAEFQKRCFKKMEEVVGSDGRTILFVSHNMRAIQTLCTQGILLKKGMTTGKKEIAETIFDYAVETEANAATSFPVSTDDVTIHGFTVSQNGYPASDYDGDLPIDFEIDFELHNDLTLFRLGFYLKNTLGDVILRSLIADWNPEYENLKRGQYSVKGRIPERFLTTGIYVVELHASRYGIRDYGMDELVRVEISVRASTKFIADHIGERPSGFITLDPGWTLSRV